MHASHAVRLLAVQEYALACILKKKPKKDNAVKLWKM